MKNISLKILLCLLSINLSSAFAQSELDFDEYGFRQAFGWTSGSPTLVDPSNTSLTVSANVFDDDNPTYTEWTAVNTPTAGDLDDFTVSLSVNNITNLYENPATSPCQAGYDSPENQRVTTELRIRYNLGNRFLSDKRLDGNPQNFTGDVLSNTVEVRFADHFTIYSDELTVSYTSGNTRGTSVESTVIIFFDEDGNDSICTLSPVFVLDTEDKVTGNTLKATR